MLVHAGDGAWVVREDGRKRRLGGVRDSTWSPGGLYLGAARGRELVALEPDGDERWTLPAPGPVSDPRWSPDGFRIAYRGGRDLYVTIADNSARWRLARRVAAIPAAWQPGRPDGRQVLAFAAGRRIRIVEVDRRRTLGVTAAAAPPRELWWSDRRLIAVMTDEIRVHDARGRLLRRLALPPRLRTEGSALDPSGRRLAVVAPRAGGRSSELLLYRLDRSARPQRIFAGPGLIEGLAWSIDGSVLALGLPSANQWLFLRPRGGLEAVVSGIARQFGQRVPADFPRPAGWCYRERDERDPLGQPPCTAGSTG
jgi:dipeptidyl aminopeptidase/acylaminoacyl peptidase